MSGDGKEWRAGVLLWGAQDVVRGADGEVARGGGGEVGELLGGSGAGSDEVELGLEVGEGDRFRLGEGIHVHRCFGRQDACGRVGV